MLTKKKEGVLPSSKLILGYSNVFGKSLEFNRLELLKKVSKTDILIELAGLNFRLKGQKSLAIDMTFETQRKELLYFCGGDEKLYDKFASRIDFASPKREPFLFSRQACLFGLEEVIQSDLQVIDNFKMSPSAWEAILMYILCINDEITKIDEYNPEEPINFETLNPKLLPISELMIVSDPFQIIYRGWNLMIYLENNSETSSHMLDYFMEKYSVTYERFIFELLRMWMANKHENDHFNFYYNLSEENESKNYFEALSENYVNDEIYKLLNIRKNPFFKSRDNEYILTDLTNLLDKAYYQFINDFFFDKLNEKERQPGRKFTMQDYKGIIGGFFESYVRDLINYTFTNSRNIIVKTFDQLQVKGAGGSLVECGDIYIRHENKVLFGEVKASSLYDNEKFGGNVDRMYKNNRNLFFKSFGVDQLVYNIKNIEVNIGTIDSEFLKRKKIRIWPIIIFNEKAFQTPFMAQIFNSRFKELMNGSKSKRCYVYPLTIVHISDLENLECKLNKSPHLIWDLLSDNFSNPAKFIPPFYNTLNRNNIRADYARFRSKVITLFDKFGGV